MLFFVAFVLVQAFVFDCNDAIYMSAVLFYA